LPGLLFGIGHDGAHVSTITGCQAGCHLADASGQLRTQKMALRQEPLPSTKAADAAALGP
jgi:hypothetical protein